MLLFNYFFVHGSWHLLYGSGLYMLCAEKLKSKDNLSLARAPAKLGKKSMSIILIQNNSSLFILGQNRIIKYVSQINWLQPIIKSKLISINFMGFVYFSKWTWESPHFTFTSVDAKLLYIYKYFYECHAIYDNFCFYSISNLSLSFLPFSNFVV